MRKNLGILIRKNRESHNLTRDDLARKLKISECYVGHLENENPAAPISGRLILAIKRCLEIDNQGFLQLAERHNQRVSRYQRQRRKLAA